MKRKHVIITGTGRAGTSFLMQLLTSLGLDTGFDPKNLQSWGVRTENQHTHSQAKAGFEIDIRRKDIQLPYIIKHPAFRTYARQIINRNDMQIEHVFIPMRNLYEAAESRRVNEKKILENPECPEKYLKRRRAIPGGLSYTSTPEKQEEILLQQMYELILVLSESDIPITLLHYPTLTTDIGYLYKKLKPVLKNISYETFKSTFQKVVRPDWVHSFPQTR